MSYITKTHLVFRVNIFLILILFTCVSCENHAPATYSSEGLDGYVFDAESKEPVEGAAVTVEWQFYEVGSGYHGTVREYTFAKREATTDKAGYFKVNGWEKTLAKGMYYFESSPILKISAPEYLLYRIFTQKPDISISGKVRSIPTGFCNPNGNKYYLDAADKTASVTHRVDRIDGKLFDRRSKPISGASITVSWTAYPDICISSLPYQGRKELASFTTLTDSHGGFSIAPIDFGDLPAGYKFPIDQPYITIKCRFMPNSTDESMFENGNFQTSVKRRFHSSENIEVDWLEERDGEKSGNVLKVDYSKCHLNKSNGFDVITDEWKILY